MTDEQRLSGGSVSDVVRVGDTVRRVPRRWTPAVHLLLQHLEDVGFDGAPRVLGYDEQGREVLTFIEGTPATRPWPPALRTDEGVAALASLLRRYHDAVASFAPPADVEWFTGARALEPGEIILHGDLGPWNIVYRDDQPAGFIDWDFAEPGRPMADVAELAFFAVPMRDDDHCTECGFDAVPDRAQRLRVFADAYGATDVAAIVDHVEANWELDIRRIEEFGPKGVTPWDGFYERGIQRYGPALPAWVRSNRSLLA